MNQTLSKVVQWTTFIFIVLISLFGVLLPAGVLMLQPTFFPNLDVSGFSTSMQNVGIIVSFLSVVLSVVSAFQSSSNTKETRQTLDELQKAVSSIQQEQYTIASYLHQPNIEVRRNFPGLNFTWGVDKYKK